MNSLPPLISSIAEYAGLQKRTTDRGEWVEKTPTPLAPNFRVNVWPIYSPHLRYLTSPAGSGYNLVVVNPSNASLIYLDFPNNFVAFPNGLDSALPRLLSTSIL
jgi:hypothetical protein